MTTTDGWVVVRIACEAAPEWIGLDDQLEYQRLVLGKHREERE